VEAPDERDIAARVALADTLREVTHTVMGHEQDPQRLARVRQLLEAELDGLRSGPRRSRPVSSWTGRWEQSPPDDGGWFEDYPFRPVSGAANPWSIPLRVRRQGDRAVTTVRLGSAFEGAPARSHGGVVSAIFDDLCGYVLLTEQVMAYTASLTIGYRAATPLHEPITFSCWLDRREGRKLYMAGACHGGEQLLTTCDALFIAIETPDVEHQPS
jgi:hypothetical protein